jgi:endonuclease/exonuclease/phosphatase family metal-dependent hydrolase
VICAEAGNVTTVANYSADNVDIEVGGEYVLVFRYTDRREITSIDDVLELFTIENGSNPLVVRLAKLEREFATFENEEVEVDNSAKSVFSIMSYNVGRWYNGSGQKVPYADFEKFLALQESIIDRYSPDILCVQEYSDDIASGKSALEYLIKSRYYFHPTALGTTSYDGKAICTNRSLSDATNIVFTTKEAALNRNYEKAYVYMNGRKVCVISAHLSQGQTECASNIQQILTDIQNETYVIICADTNVDASYATAEKYQATLKQFIDAGYVLANNGELKTYPATPSAIDNIIVTSNITIKSTIVDTQKLEFLALSDVDHLPLISYIELY